MAEPVQRKGQRHVHRVALAGGGEGRGGEGAYLPLAATKLAWSPTSSTRPLCMTMIGLAVWMVLKRWAMDSVVTPRMRDSSSSSSAACTTRSDSVSRADVASSSSRIFGSRMMALAHENHGLSQQK